MSETRSHSLDPQRLGAAVELAADFHGDQVRKGTQIPYLSHVLAVAALVAEDLGTEDAVLAALLHDAAEDQGGEEALALIVARLGESVAGIVRECSDSIGPVGAAKAPWRERKQATIDGLPNKSPDALLVIAADKLHNVRSTVTDVEQHGAEVWQRFKTGREGFVWYHQEMLAALERLIPRSRSVGLLAEELTRL